MMWCPPYAPGTITDKQIHPRLALIAALDSNGNTYFSLLHGITNSDIMLLFLSSLCRELSREDVNWRENTVILLDGATYHTSDETRSHLKKLKVQVIFSGPYSYSTAPIEMLLAGIKDRKLCSYK